MGYIHTRLIERSLRQSTGFTDCYDAGNFYPYHHCHKHFYSYSDNESYGNADC